MKTPNCGIIRIGILILGLQAASPTASAQSEQPSAKIEAHVGEVTVVSFSPDGKTFASGGADGFVKVWDVGSGRLLMVLNGQKRRVYSVAFASDGATVAVGTGYPGSLEVNIGLFPPVARSRRTLAQGEIKLWSLVAGTERSVFPIANDVPIAVALSADGNELFSGGRAIRCWNLANHGERTLQMGGAGGAGVEDVVAIGKGGKYVGIGTVHGEVKMSSSGRIGPWSARHGSQVISIAFSPDSKVIASGGIELKLWEVSTGHELAFLRGHRGGVFALAFAPNSRILASGSGSWNNWQFHGGEIRLWDVDTRKQIAMLEGHSTFVNSLAISPDGTTIVSGGDDGTVLLWRVPVAKHAD